MQSECESIGTDTIGMSRDEMMVLKNTLDHILETTDDFKVKVEAKYLLDLINRKLKA